MCRFLIYKGRDPILLSSLITSPQHSILTQSYDSRLRLDTRRPHNADGFGLGYYTDPLLGSDPCVFTSTAPAWNCLNLSRLASKTRSSLIFAHVRAATNEGGSMSEANCHPFVYGTLMWMHNGNIAGWKQFVKRELALDLDQRWFLRIHGNTDSEWAFALFLDCLCRIGVDPDDPHSTISGFGHSILREAMLMTIQRINGYVAKTARQSQKTPEPAFATTTESGEDALDMRSLLNFAVTDGHSVVCTRYVSSKSDEAASLYFSSGTDWSSTGRQGQYRMQRRDKGADIVLVASEPLTFERDNWVSVPTNSVLTISNQTVLLHPIIDDFHAENPSHVRSQAFAGSKGLVCPLPEAIQKDIEVI